jgi:hypothetical protein
VDRSVDLSVEAEQPKHDDDDHDRPDDVQDRIHVGASFAVIPGRMRASGQSAVDSEEYGLTD